MANDSRLKIVKSLIEEGRLKTLSEVFDYIPKTRIAKELGINYTRFLALIKNPKAFRYSETIAIARILGVTPRQISDLVHTQLEAKKK